MVDKLDKLSVIIPVSERAENTIAVYEEYRQTLEAAADKLDFIFIISQDERDLIQSLRNLPDREGCDTNIIVLSKSYGDATAVKAGIEQVNSDLVLILPPYKQIETPEILKLFDAIEGFDIALAVRHPRIDTQKNQIQTKVFNGLLKRLSGQQFSDIGCGVRLVRRQVLEEVHLYGDQLRFLPLLAYQLGFHSKEVPLQQASEETSDRIYTPGIYIRRFLDLLTVTFLTKFNKKPLRFFGLVGTASISLGSVGLMYLAVDKLVFDAELADRPLLVLFSLFFVLGAQLISIGLIGETVIFTHAKDHREYRIKEIINGGR